MHTPTIYTNNISTHTVASSETVRHENNHMHETASSSPDILSKAFKYIRIGHWQKLEEMLLSDKGEFLCSMKDSSGLSVLSVAVISYPPIDILQLILNLNPSASLEPDKFGAVPLTLACLNGASAGVIKTVLEHDNGMSATVPDGDKRVALHHAVEYAARINVHELTNEQTKATMDSFNFSVNGSDCSTRMNTSILSDSDFANDIEVIKLICDASPEMIHFASSNGDTPLDVMHIIRGRCKSEAQRNMVEYVYYSVLRQTSVNVYMGQKKEWEEYGPEDFIQD